MFTEHDDGTASIAGFELMSASLPKQKLLSLDKTQQGPLARLHEPKSRARHCRVYMTV
jgi:hypothetical protein